MTPGIDKNPHKHRVEQWWDRHSRNWVTYRLDSHDYQVGDAHYTGTRENAAIATRWMKADLAKDRAEWDRTHRAKRRGGRCR